MVLLLNLLSKSYTDCTVTIQSSPFLYSTVYFLGFDKRKCEFFSNFSPRRATDSVSPHMKKERASWTGGRGGGGGGALFWPRRVCAAEQGGCLFLTGES